MCYVVVVNEARKYTAKWRAAALTCPLGGQWLCTRLPRSGPLGLPLLPGSATSAAAASATYHMQSSSAGGRRTDDSQITTLRHAEDFTTTHTADSLHVPVAPGHQNPFEVVYLVHGQGIGRGLRHVVLALIWRNVIRRGAVPADQ